MGSRGPQPVDRAALKIRAVQWFYFVIGLRDGHPDLMQRHVWGPWSGEKQEIRAGRAERILLARIVPDGSGGETARLVFERLRTWASRRSNEEPQFESPLFQTLEQDFGLPAKWRFGLKPLNHPTLVFPSLNAQPKLWSGLKEAHSAKALLRIGEVIYQWLADAQPGIAETPEYRTTLCERSEEILSVRGLWNYPRTNRPKSDDKRIEFYAEAFAGLSSGVSPATATKKLARWIPPRLWDIKFDLKQPGR